MAREMPETEGYDPFLQAAMARMNLEQQAERLTDLTSTLGRFLICPCPPLPSTSTMVPRLPWSGRPLSFSPHRELHDFVLVIISLFLFAIALGRFYDYFLINPSIPLKY